MLIFAHKTMKDFKSLMKKKLYNALPVMFLSLLLFITSCGDETKEKAELLLKQAQEQCDNGDYDKTLALIDTLRNKYPKAIEARKKALVLYSEASEKQAQKRLDDIVIELEKAESKFQELDKTVKAHKKNNKATAAELTALTLARMHRDSVKTMFDAECEKIKYIHKKRKEGIQ